MVETKFIRKHGSSGFKVTDIDIAFNNFPLISFSNGSARDSSGCFSFCHIVDEEFLNESNLIVFDGLRMNFFISCQMKLWFTEIKMRGRIVSSMQVREMAKPC